MVLKCFENTTSLRLRKSVSRRRREGRGGRAPSFSSSRRSRNDMGGSLSSPQRIKMQIRINKPGRRFPASVDLPPYIIFVGRVRSGPARRNFSLSPPLPLPQRDPYRVCSGYVIRIICFRVISHSTRSDYERGRAEEEFLIPTSPPNSRVRVSILRGGGMWRKREYLKFAELFYCVLNFY